MWVTRVSDFNNVIRIYMTGIYMTIRALCGNNALLFNLSDFCKTKPYCHIYRTIYLLTISISNCTLVKSIQLKGGIIYYGSSFGALVLVLTCKC